ncbi:MAG: PD40 domain-containing protein [Phycisphaeraceae bacterium]|nr:PD40 domain-containing protein [Phycisphaeraceae bacterium]
MGKLFEELKHRKVFRVAAIYAVVAWVLIQVADTIAPMMNLPESAPRFILFVLAILFPVALFLAWAYEVTPEGVKADTSIQVIQSTTSSTDRNLIYAILVLVLLVAGFQAADRFSVGDEVNSNASTTLSSPTPGTGNGKVTRALINLGSMQRRPIENLFTDFDFTPDGTKLVYSSYANGNSQLHVRSLDSLDSRSIFQSRTISAFSPKVSPSGEEIVFITSRGTLYRMPITGGTPTRISSEKGHAGYAWLDNQNLIAAQLGIYAAGFVSLRLSDGAEEPLALEGEIEGSQYRNPQLLPGNEFLMYSIQVANSNNPHVGIADLSSHQSRILLQDAFAATYVPSGHIVFMRGNDLWAVAFDLDNRAVVSQEVLLIRGVENYSQQMFAVYSISPTGQLLYVPGGDQFSALSNSELVKIDDAGQESVIDLPPQRYTDYQISPDGSQLAMTVNEAGGRDIWVYHLQRGTLSKVTFSGDSRNAIWSVDGESLLYEDGSSGRGLWKIKANGLGLAEQLIATPGRAIPRAISPDGSKLVFRHEPGGSGGFNLNMLSFANAEVSQQVLIGSEFDEEGAAISPDGSWLAYSSTESGRDEVYVRPFPNVDDDKIQISSDGGGEPQWSADGSTLFFIDDSETALVSVPVSFESGFSFGLPTTLALVPAGRADSPTYTIFPDSKSVLIKRNTGADGSSQSGSRIVNAVIVENWLEELKRLVPVPE